MQRDNYLIFYFYTYILGKSINAQSVIRLKNNQRF